MHFHWGENNDEGSEHALDGKLYLLEVYLVYYSCDYLTINDALIVYSGGSTEQYDDENVLAVIGVLFEIGEANPAIDKMLSDSIMNGVQHYDDPVDENEGVLSLYYTEFDLGELLPTIREYYGYEGSLTTPPCYETVRWHVMKDTMTISQEQIEKFQNIWGSEDEMAPNYRPVQAINGREIYECEEDVLAHNVEKDHVLDVMVGDDGDEDGDDGYDLWFIIGIVFICLFGVAVLIIGSLLYYMNGMKYQYKKCQSPREAGATPKQKELALQEQEPLA